MNPGILFAFLAFFAWGIGDFLIQKTARQVGDWAALFYVDLFAAGGLLPFVWPALFGLNSGDWLLLLLISAVNFTAAILDFDALKVGKISVVEPIYALEIGVTAALAMGFLNEILKLEQWFLILVLTVGIALVSVRALHHFRNIRLEKGVWLALLTTFFMGGTNFLYGVGSRQVDPLTVNWITSTFIVLVCLAYLFSVSRLGELRMDWRRHKKLLLSTSIVDNSAWIFFAYATLSAPVAIVTAISESYIALAAFLGVWFNREKLQRHQWLGLCLAIAAAVLLAATLG